MNKRPLSITIIACLYILTGVVACAAHLMELKGQQGFQYDIILAELTNVAAIVAGVFMLRGRNWARWLALAWIAFHVVLSIFHPLRELLIHALLCAVLAWLLFRAAASRYFRAGGTQTA